MYIHKTASALNICRQECPSLHLLRSDTAFLGHLFKIQEYKPIFSLPLSETPDEAYVALLFTLQQGQSLGQMLPYQLTEGIVWRMTVYNKEKS